MIAVARSLGQPSSGRRILSAGLDRARCMLRAVRALACGQSVRRWSNPSSKVLIVRSSAVRIRVLSVATTISMGEEPKVTGLRDGFQRCKGPGCRAAGTAVARLRSGPFGAQAGRSAPQTPPKPRIVPRPRTARPNRFPVHQRHRDPRPDIHGQGLRYAFQPDMLEVHHETNPPGIHSPVQSHAGRR